jgi:hypothetical protein
MSYLDSRGAVFSMREVHRLTDNELRRRHVSVDSREFWIAQNQSGPISDLRPRRLSSHDGRQSESVLSLDDHTGQFSWPLPGVLALHAALGILGFDGQRSSVFLAGSIE